jgi:hypothetical protein
MFQILGNVVANNYGIKTNYKANEIKRTLAVFLFIHINFSNGEALQATEVFFSSNIREILSVE